MVQLALEGRDSAGHKYYCTPMPSIKPGIQSVLNNCMAHEWTVPLFTGYAQSHTRNAGPTLWFTFIIGGRGLAHPE